MRFLGFCLKAIYLKACFTESEIGASFGHFWSLSGHFRQDQAAPLITLGTL